MDPCQFKFHVGYLGFPVILKPKPFTLDLPFSHLLSAIEVTLFQTFFCFDQLTGQNAEFN